MSMNNEILHDKHELQNIKFHLFDDISRAACDVINSKKDYDKLKQQGHKKNSWGTTKLECLEYYYRAYGNVEAYITSYDMASFFGNKGYGKWLDFFVLNKMPVIKKFTILRDTFHKKAKQVDAPCLHWGLYKSSRKYVGNLMKSAKHNLEDICNKQGYTVHQKMVNNRIHVYLLDENNHQPNYKKLPDDLQLGLTTYVNFMNNMRKKE